MNIIYNDFSKEVLVGNIKPEEEEFKIALFTSEYEPSSEHTKYDRIRADEVSGEGYEEGGKNISLNRLGEDSNYIRYGTGAIIKWICPNLAFRYAIIYRVKDNMLVSCYDLKDHHTSASQPEITLDWTSSYLLSFAIGSSSELNMRKIKDEVYKYVIEDPDNELKESVHEYIIENSDTELDDESTNTIQNRAVINSVEGLDHEDIDEMFD